MVQKWLDLTIGNKDCAPTNNIFNCLYSLFSSSIKLENKRLFEEYSENILKKSLKIFTRFGWIRHFEYFNLKLLDLLMYVLNKNFFIFFFQKSR